jgi:hypothetical protein
MRRIGIESRPTHFLYREENGAGRQETGPRLEWDNINRRSPRTVDAT